MMAVLFKLRSKKEDVEDAKGFLNIEKLLSSGTGTTIAFFLEPSDLLRLTETSKSLANLLSGTADPYDIWKQLENTELARAGSPLRNKSFPRTYDIKTHAMMCRIENEIKYCTNRIHAIQTHHDVLCQRYLWNEEYYWFCMTKERELAALEMLDKEIPELVARRSNLEACLRYPGEPRALEFKATVTPRANTKVSLKRLYRNRPYIDRSQRRYYKFRQAVCTMKVLLSFDRLPVVGQEIPAWRLIMEVRSLQDLKLALQTIEDC